MLMMVVVMLVLASGYIVILFRSNRIININAKILAQKSEEIEKQQTEIMSQKTEIEIQNQHLQTALSELRKTQFQLVQSEKMASLGLLIAGMAHEINNPVNFIRVGADCIKDIHGQLNRLLELYDGINTDTQTEKLTEINDFKKGIRYEELREDMDNMVKTILTGTSRITAIVTSLSKFSRRGDEKTEETDLYHLVQDSVLLISGEIKDRINIQINWSPDVPAILCRPSELNQVFLNLLLNAFQSIEDKGSIKITGRRFHSAVIICIEDNGRGIARDHLSRIFDPFFTTKEVGKGMGLGLSIVHGIIQNHGGEIVVDSEFGKGSRFIISLPV